VTIAITREVSPGMGQCELTHIPRQAIDIEGARSQHRQYERALVELGCLVKRLSEEPDLPDSVFVEDAAIVLDEMAIITRPGVESRRGETRTVSEALGGYRTIFNIVSPGTLEGGDVLKVDRTLYVGVSGRSNDAGVEQLAGFVSPYEYEVVKVHIDGCLHLKSAVTYVGEETLLINRSWVDAKSFPGMGFIEVDPGEPYAANALLVEGGLVYPANFPRTCRRLVDRGYPVKVVDVSELQKAEGAVTCCSLIFRKSRRPTSD
jgi:dimethylargininase